MAFIPSFTADAHRVISHPGRGLKSQHVPPCCFTSASSTMPSMFFLSSLSHSRRQVMSKRPPSSLEIKTPVPVSVAVSAAVAVRVHPALVRCKNHPIPRASTSHSSLRELAHAPRNHKSFSKSKLLNFVSEFFAEPLMEQGNPTDEGEENAGGEPPCCRCSVQ
jgi:hypothetical protein